MTLGEDLRSIWQLIELLGIVSGYHLVKLAGNLIDREEGVIEQRVSQLVSRRILRHFDIKVEVTGAEKVGRLEPYAVACTHASHLDWAVLLGHFPSPLRFIAKRELARVPVIGDYLRLRGVLIDRARGIDAQRAISAALADKSQPWPFLIFPEGTRSHDGKVGRFRTGGLRILIKQGLTLVPVAIQGTFEILPRGTGLIRTGRQVRVVIGDPVRPQDYPSMEATLAELERRIRAAAASAP